ncbi:hypothetical protein ACLSU7_03365 [Bdellovibrio sp. HCB185ZH]|uniref:hypothetical protein n=1 Tax=Bdellovibrio sp. HCB185ZH TaxID=3394235 RepID=UPI0039A644C8
MRLLYASTHPTLLPIDVRSFLSAGFEVVPTFAHTQFKGRHRLDPKPIDNPLSSTNKSWKRVCTIPPEDVVKIQMTDFYRIADLPYTMRTSIPSRVENPHYAHCGDVSESEAELINKYFDVIVVQSFPNLVPNILKWFKGIVVFRVFGNENVSFSVWDWYKNHLYSAGFLEFMLNPNRYISLSVFQGIIDTERQQILGSSPSLLYAAVYEDIIKLVGQNRWKRENSKPIAVTNISYLDVSPSWRSYYEEFKKSFQDIPFHVYGKNLITDEYCKQDHHICGQIDDFQEYLGRYCDYRVFCNVGKIKQHSQYTPFEAAAMGIPVLFLSTSAIANEAKTRFSLEDLEKMGMCSDLDVMAVRANSCIENLTYAVSISELQQKMFFEVFGVQRTKTQATSFYNKCKELLSEESMKDSLLASLNKPSENRNKRILWAFPHKTNRFEEFPNWISAGFEIVPLRMPSHQGRYQGASYDNPSDPFYPDWKTSCTLPQDVLNVLTSITLSQSDDRQSGKLTKKEIEWLNNHFGYIYTPYPLSIAVNLLSQGYKGIILNRYFGHYAPGTSLARISKYVPFGIFKLFNNYIWMPAMSKLTSHESSLIAKKNATCFVPYLYRSSDYFNDIQWQGKNTHPVVAAVMSSIYPELTHYYENFVKYFGQFPYKIYGKNFSENLKKGGIEDSNIVGMLEKESSVYEEMSKSRVYVEVGLVNHHSHYTPVEALLIGVPVVFWEGCGFATEMLENADRKFLLERGMCETWEQMVCLTEKCMDDVEFAIALSQKQKEMIPLLPNKNIVEKMKAVMVMGDKLRNSFFIWDMPLFSQVRTLIVKLMWIVNDISRNVGDGRPARVIKRFAYVVFVLAGLKEDKRGLKVKLSLMRTKAMEYLK